MSMIHLKYPQKRGFFTWEEMGCLARALGFQVDLFSSNIPEDFLKKNKGVTISEIQKMMDYKYFNKTVDRTFNMHTADWNLCVIRKALRLLDYNVLSFEELQDIRVAYHIYEDGDMKGMLLEEAILLRALKMCGRTISPMKMMQRIKHMQGDFEEQGRIQLYEFLDLILWCDLYDSIALQQPEPAEAAGKDKLSLYKMDNFTSFLQHYDELLADHLNKIYLDEEWDFGKEIITTQKRLPREPPVKTEARQYQVKFHKNRYQYLKNVVTDSEKRVYNAKAGTVRPRPISAPDLSAYEPRDPSIQVSAVDLRPQTVYETLQAMTRPKTGATTEVESTPRPSIKEFRRTATPHAVTVSDLSDTENRIESLKFEMETMESRYHELVEHDLEYLRPGFRERMDSRPKPEPPPPPKKIKIKEQRPSDEFLTRLTYEDLRKQLPPTHSKSCDARFRGFYPVKVQRGAHYILASPTYDHSTSGRLYMKLRQSAAKEIDHVHDDRIFRYAKPSQIVRDRRSRPHTAVPTQTTLRAHDYYHSNSNEEEKVQHISPAPSKETFETLHSKSDTLPNAPNAEAVKDESITDSEVSWGDFKLFVAKKEDNEEQENQKKKEKPKRRRERKEKEVMNISKDHEKEAVPASKPMPNIVAMRNLGKISLLENIMETDTVDSEDGRESGKCTSGVADNHLERERDGHFEETVHERGYLKSQATDLHVQSLSSDEMSEKGVKFQPTPHPPVESRHKTASPSTVDSTKGNLNRLRFNLLNNSPAHDNQDKDSDQASLQSEKTLKTKANIAPNAQNDKRSYSASSTQRSVNRILKELEQRPKSAQALSERQKAKKFNRLLKRVDGMLSDEMCKRIQNSVKVHS